MLILSTGLWAACRSPMQHLASRQERCSQGMDRRQLCIWIMGGVLTQGVAQRIWCGWSATILRRNRRLPIGAVHLPAICSSGAEALCRQLQSHGFGSPIFLCRVAVHAFLMATPVASLPLRFAILNSTAGFSNA